MEAAFNGIKPCIIGKNCITTIVKEKDILPTVVTIVLATVYFGFRKICKKKMSPIVLILVAAFTGIVVYSFIER